MRSAEAVSRTADRERHVVSSMMQSVPPVAVQPPYLLFLAKIVQSIAVIVSRLSGLPVHNAMTPTTMVGAITGALMVVTVIVTAVMVAEIDAIATGKKRT